MFIIFNKIKKIIYSYGVGNPTESGNKLYLGNTIICNDLTVCDWKYIADQRLEQDENGFVHGADYYEELMPSLPDSSRIAALEQMIIEMQLGV